jgi:hypothetical protein
MSLDPAAEVRALEARLAEAEVKVAWNAGASERADRAEALVAEWRPVVRAAVLLSNADLDLSGKTPMDTAPVLDSVAALSPAAREAAR